MDRRGFLQHVTAPVVESLATTSCAFDPSPEPSLADHSLRCEFELDAAKSTIYQDLRTRDRSRGCCPLAVLRASCPSTWSPPTRRRRRLTWAPRWRTLASPGTCSPGARSRTETIRSRSPSVARRFTRSSVCRGKLPSRAPSSTPTRCHWAAQWEISSSSQPEANAISKLWGRHDLNPGCQRPRSPVSARS